MAVQPPVNLTPQTSGHLLSMLPGVVSAEVVEAFSKFVSAFVPHQQQSQSAIPSSSMSDGSSVGIVNNTAAVVDIQAPSASAITGELFTATAVVKDNASAAVSAATDGVSDAVLGSEPSGSHSKFIWWLHLDDKQ